MNVKVEAQTRQRSSGVEYDALLERGVGAGWSGIFAVKVLVETVCDRQVVAFYVWPGCRSESAGVGQWQGSNAQFYTRN